MANTYDGNMDSTFKGPQLTFNKTFLFMNAEKNKSSHDTVVIKNQGTTTVTYEWKKVHRGDHISSKKSDFVQRFFCHYPRSILKPKESKTFTFSFKSDKIGMFNEEWELLTEPLLLSSLPQVCLSGIATQEDQYKKRRADFWQAYDEEFAKRETVDEDITSWSSNIKHPIVAEADLNDPLVFKKIFEDVNRHLGLYHTNETMENFFDIFDDICLLAERSGKKISKWDCRVETIEKLISEVANPYTKKMLSDRYVSLLCKARKTPNDRALSFSVINKLSHSFVENAIDHEAKFRAQLEMLPIEGIWQPIPEDSTPEQRAAQAQAELLKREDAAKKAKKKPKTRDEELNDIKELINRTTSALSTQITEVAVDKCEHEIEILKTEWMMENNLCMDAVAFEKLNRKISILDIDISDQEVVLRADLDVPLTPFVHFKPIEEEFKELIEQLQEEATQDAAKQKKVKKTKKQLEDEAEQMARYEQAKKMRSEPWKTRQILDHKLLKRTEVSLKYLQEKLAKRIIVLSSIGEMCGRTELQNSIRSLVAPLQGLLTDQQVQFLQDSALEKFSQVEEGLKEGTVYLLENLNFRPDEHSFVKAWVDPEEPVKKKEEKKVEEAPVVDLKKMSAAEKKKYEEEQKRREEELAKTQPTEAEIQKEAAKKHQKDLEAKKRKEVEYFDYKTTYRYIQNLRKLGAVYVNDAPLACLTTSNSVAEMKCKLNVMGIKMTEDIRKMAQFFMKPFPLDIQARHYDKPLRRPYFSSKFTAVIGGMCKSHGEMLDKILMVNQLIEQATKIYFAGDMGLAAVSCLMEIKVAKVDHNSLNFLDYSRFFKRLFLKAKQMGCELVLPVDFQCAPKVTKEMIADYEKKTTFESKEIDLKASFDNKTTVQKSIPQKKDIISPPIERNEIAEKSTHPEVKSSMIWAANPNLHWTDVAILAQKDYIVDLEEQMLQRNEDRQSRMMSAVQDNDVVMSVPSTASTKFNPEEHMLQYGPKTLSSLCDAVESSFKIFWDGSISLYQDTTKSSSNNKGFLNALLEVRTTSDQDQEPPVTLIHGSESEQTLRKTLLRIKIDQQEALESLKAKQAAEAGESEAEQDVNLSESKAEISTFQEDMETICDFLVSDCTTFTTRLLQGAHIKSLYAFDEHRKPTLAEEVEELSLLEKI